MNTMILKARKIDVHEATDLPNVVVYRSSNNISFEEVIHLLHLKDGVVVSDITIADPWEWRLNHLGWTEKKLLNKARREPTSGYPDAYRDLYEFHPEDNVKEDPFT